MKSELRACRGEPLDTFYGGGFKKALSLCHRCPVRQACLDEAVEEELKGVELGSTYYVHGTRGGMTATERKHYYKLLVEAGRVGPITKTIAWSR